MSRQIGIQGEGTSYGASWGDLNGDGNPDLWTGNHDLPATLYLNQGDGTFTTYAMPSGLQPNADLHGAAWADFDADGDQDLFIAVDARYENGLLVEAVGEDVLLINDGDTLKLSASDDGDLIGRASRQPLWLDADLDGDLDVFIVGRKTPASRKTNNVLFLQDNNARLKTSALSFETLRTTRRDRYLGLLENVLRGRFKMPVDVMVTPHQESAQLVDLNNDYKAELWLLNAPSRVYSLGEIADVTFTTGLPEASNVVDVSVVDIDQDGFNDIVAVQGPYRSSDVVRIDTHRLEATLLGHSKAVKKVDAKGIDLITEGSLTIEMGPTWFPSSRVAVLGHDAPMERVFTLEPEGVDPLSNDALNTNKLIIGRTSDRWQLRHAVDWEHVDLRISSSKPIVDFETVGFQPHTANGVLSIYYGGEDGFGPANVIAKNVSCFSVVTEDLDNDSDLDIYAVCTGPIRNHANMLFQNISPRSFSLIEDAGGASGSTLGRGDVVASSDYDGDGDVDLFVTNGADPSSFFVEQGPHELFVNQNETGNWVEVELIGEGKNAHGYGATIELFAGGKVLRRTASGGMHRFTQNYHVVHFGLADNALIDRIRIHWPRGSTTELIDVSANQIIQIEE